MRFVRNLLKSVTLVAAVVLANATYAQKMSDLLVTKDAKPGQWVSTPTQIPKGLEAHMKADTACASKEQFLERLNKSIQFFSPGKDVKNICPTTLVSDTPTEAIMKTTCTKKTLGIDAEMTNSIKRTNKDTWVFTLTSPDSKGAASTMQTTMKYIGECRS